MVYIVISRLNSKQNNTKKWVNNTSKGSCEAYVKQTLSRAYQRAGHLINCQVSYFVLKY